MAKKLIPMAISYDFDGTLAPGNMQEYDFIPALNMRSKKFWDSVNDLAKTHEMDQILAYMHVMLEEARKAHIPVRKADFKNFGAHIALFPGVIDWFKRIDTYAKGKGIRLEHFIISSGIRGNGWTRHTDYKVFKKVYASGFHVRCTASLVGRFAVNYTTENTISFSRRLDKGSLDVHDNLSISQQICT